MSNYFDAKGNGEQAIAQLATKILAGQEMGYGPFASVQGIHVIQGKTHHECQPRLAQSRTRHAMTIVCARWKTPPSASNSFERIGGKLESLGVSTFTLEDAKRPVRRTCRSLPVTCSLPVP